MLSSSGKKSKANPIDRIQRIREHLSEADYLILSEKLTPGIDKDRWWLLNNAGKFIKDAQYEIAAL